MASKEELELVHDKGRNKAITFAQQGLDDDKGREKAIAQEELDDDKERKRAIARNTVVGDPPLDVIRKLKKQETKREIGAQVKMASNKGRNKAGFIPIPKWQYENPEAREDFWLYFDDDEGENVEIASSNLKGEEFVRYKCSQTRIVDPPVEMMRKYKKQLMKQRKRDERMGWTPEKLRKVTAEVEQEARRLLLSINLEKLNLNLSPEKEQEQEQEQQGGPRFISSGGCSKE